MAHIDVEKIGKAKSAESRLSVREASQKKVTARTSRFSTRQNDSSALRDLASRIRQHTLDHLDEYLVQAEENLKKNGYHVHWAADADDAKRIFEEICLKAKPEIIVKSKSMVTEEIHLNDHLENLELNPVETDLGEFVVQISDDHPSHIVTPIIHINRRMVAKIFDEQGLGEYTDDPEELTMQARHHLRDRFAKAGVGITGANFIAADTGRLITVENEGNLRLTSNVPKVHIAITGIEKVIPGEAEAAVLLKVLGASATGQDLTVYSQFLSGPKRPGEPEGPEEAHVILLDNGRTNLLGGRYHEMLRCIRCGACLNVCPVYRAVTGHGYGSVYPGPMGAIYSPLLGGEESRKEYSYLPRASSLCGACEEVCPVAIPIPKMLIALREESQRDHLPKPKGTPPFSPWAVLSTNPLLWRTALTTGKVVGWGPTKIAPVAAFKGWTEYHSLPDWPKTTLRRTLKDRKPFPKKRTENGK